MPRHNHSDEIILSALRLMSSRGYHDTSIRDIAHSVGIKESSFYNHFRGKHGLLERFMTDHMTVMEGCRPRYRNHELEDLDVMSYFINFSEKWEKEWKDEREGLEWAVLKDMRFLDEECGNHWDVCENIVRSRLTHDLKRLFDMGRMKPLDIDSLSFVITMLLFHAADSRSSDGTRTEECLRSILVPLIL